MPLAPKGQTGPARKGSRLNDEGVMSPRSMPLLLAVTGLLLGAGTSSGQTARPPVDGVTGTIALEGTMKAFYHGVNTIVVTTIDGVEHVYRFTKDLIIHGGKGSGTEALAGLGEGDLRRHSLFDRRT